MAEGMAGIAATAQGSAGPARRRTDREAIALIEGSTARASALDGLHSAGASGGEPPRLEATALRLGFWLCGFCEALRERRDSGQALTEREASLLELSRQEFAAMRPMAIEIAVRRLDAVLAGAAGGRATPAAETMEAFAHATLRALSEHAVTLLDSKGPDAAFSLLGGDPGTVEPLAIFQTAFGAALAMAESFGSLVGSGNGSLRHAAETLETEIERI